MKKSEQHKELSSWGHGAYIIVELYGNQIARATMLQEYTTQCKSNKVRRTLIDWSMNWINNLSTQCEIRRMQKKKVNIRHHCHEGIGHTSLLNMKEIIILKRKN